MGNNENTDVGSFLADYLNLDVSAVTELLKSSGSWMVDSTAHETVPEFHWMGHPLDEDVRVEGLDTYHGDFRKRSTCGCENH